MQAQNNQLTAKKGTEYLQLIDQNTLESIYGIPTRFSLETSRKAIQIIEPDYIRTLNQWINDAKNASDGMALSVKSELAAKVIDNSWWKTGFAFYDEWNYIPDATVLQNLSPSNVKWFLQGVSRSFKEQFFGTKVSDTQILEQANKGNFWSPFQIVDRFKVAEKLADKYTLSAVPSRDELFAIYGQEPDYEIVSGILKQPTGEEDYGSVYRPNEIYLLTYLINSLSTTSSVDFTTQPANTVFTMLSPNGEKVMKQFIKAFDGVDMWFGLKRPENTGRQTFKETVNFQIGPQEFFLSPTTYKNQLIWTVQHNSANLVRNEGEYLDFGKYLKQLRKDERSWTKNGTMYGLSFRNPKLGYSKVYDYYIKVDNTNWIRMRPPGKWRESDNPEIKIWKENEELRFTLDKTLFHRPDVETLTDEERKSQLLSIISKIEAFQNTVNSVTQQQYQNNIPQNIQNSRTTLSKYIGEWNRVKNLGNLGIRTIVEQAIILNEQFDNYITAVVTEFPDGPNKQALQDIRTQNFQVLRPEILTLTPETAEQLTTRLQQLQYGLDGRNRSPYDVINVNKNLENILKFVSNDKSKLITRTIIESYAGRLAQIYQSQTLKNFKNKDMNAIRTILSNFVGNPENSPDEIRSLMIQAEQVTDLVIEASNIAQKIVTEFSLMGTQPQQQSGNLTLQQINSLKNELARYANNANNNARFYIRHRKNIVIPPSVTNKTRTNVKGLGWIKNTYEIDQRGGVSMVPGSGSSSVMILDRSEIGQLAAAQIVYKSEGVLMMETLLNFLENPFKAPIRWLQNVPKSGVGVGVTRQLGNKSMFSAPIRWLSVKGNQTIVKDILVKFIMDEIDNTDLVTEGILMLLRLVHPTSSKWSRTYGNWNVSDHTKIITNFINNVSSGNSSGGRTQSSQNSGIVSGTGTGTTATSSVPPGGIPSPVSQVRPVMRGGMKGGYSLFGGMNVQTGGGCGCTGGSSEEFDVKKMIESTSGLQSGGADRFPDVQGINRYRIDPNRVNGAVDKLILMLISKENADKERMSLDGNDSLSTLSAGKDFKSGVLDVLIGMSTLSGRTRWLQQPGNKQLVELLLTKLCTEALSANKRDALIGALDALIGLFQPTGLKKFTKSSTTFNAMGIREEYLRTVNVNSSDSCQSASRALIDRLLLTSEATIVEGAKSSDDVEKVLDQYLKQLSRQLSDDRKRNYITTRAQSFQLAWVNYVDQFLSDEISVRKKLDRFIDMFRRFRPEKPNLIQTFMVQSTAEPRGKGNIQKAVNNLVSELVGASLPEPAQFGFRPNQSLIKPERDPVVPEPGAASGVAALNEQKTGQSDSEYNQMMSFIERAETDLNNRLSVYEAEFKREAARMNNKWQSQSEIRKADAAYKRDVGAKDREFTSQLRTKKSLTSSQQSELKKEWERVKNNLKGSFEGQKKLFKDEVQHNSQLAKMGLKPDSQKSWWDWAGDRLSGRAPVADYAGLQRKMKLPGRPGDGGTFQDVFRQPQSGTSVLPPGPIGTMPPPVTMSDLRREATKPGFATYIDPATGQTKTMAVTRFPMDTPADYARLQKAIMTLDPSSIKQFMNKLGDVASTLPAQQAAQVLDHFQRRVLNELDKYCIRQGWMLFNEQLNRCV